MVSDTIASICSIIVLIGVSLGRGGYELQANLCGSISSQGIFHKMALHIYLDLQSACLLASKGFSVNAIPKFSLKAH